VARRAAVHARDPHEVDVDEVVGKLDLLHPQGRVDHVQDRRVAQLEERVLFEAAELLPRQAEIRRAPLDRGLEVLLARVDRVDLSLRLGLLPLQLGEPQRPVVELLRQPVERALDAGRGLRLVREGVLVQVALGVEGRLGELVLLVGRVDLRLEPPELRVELLQLLLVGRGLGASGVELADELGVFLVERLLARRHGLLAGQLRVEAHEGPLDRLPVSRVVVDDHQDEDEGQDPGRPEEGAVEPGNVVVMIDRLGGRLAGHD
jgi:hypothetical protein